MVKHLKRLAVLLIILGGLYALFRLDRGLFDYPYLYLDLSRAGPGNVIFGALALLALALALVAAVYLMFNADGRIRELLIPLACFLALGAVSYFSLSRGLQGIPCTYTTSLTAFNEDFDWEDFNGGEMRIYPKKQRGLVSGYAYYVNGETCVRRVTAQYEVARYFAKEIQRLEKLDLDAFSQENETVYTLDRGDSLWQVVADADAQKITYTRYDKAGDLPRFLSEPRTEPEETEPTRPLPVETGDTEAPETGDTEVPASDTGESETDQT